jgi:hypothetical protein
LNPARGCDAKEQVPTCAVEKAAQCLHPGVKFASRLLELDVFPLTPAIDDEYL